MRRIGDAPLVRRLLIGAALLLSALFLLLPLVAIFAQAFSHPTRHWSHAGHRVNDHPHLLGVWRCAGMAGDAL